MTSNAKNTRSNVISGMHYRDAPAAIEWLCKAFGFEKHFVYANPDGTIAHAELTLGNGMIMLGSVCKETEWGKRMKQPDEIGGHVTQSVNIIAKDADAVYKTAKAVGAEMIFDITDKPYGGRGFSCKDLEGHIWHVGTYDPWDPK